MADDTDDTDNTDNLVSELEAGVEAKPHSLEAGMADMSEKELYRDAQAKYKAYTRGAGAAGAASAAHQTPATQTPANQKPRKQPATFGAYQRGLEAQIVALEEQLAKQVDGLREIHQQKCRCKKCKCTGRASALVEIQRLKNNLESLEADRTMHMDCIEKLQQQIRELKEPARQPSQRTPEEQEQLIKLQQEELVAQKEYIETLRQQLSVHIEALDSVGNDTEANKIFQQACENQKLQAALGDRETEYMETLEKMQAEATAQRGRVDSARILAEKAIKNTQSAKQELESKKEELANLQAAHAHASKSWRKLGDDNAQLLVTNGKLTQQLRKVTTDNCEAVQTLKSIEEKNDSLAAKLREAVQAQTESLAAKERAEAHNRTLAMEMSNLRSFEEDWIVRGKSIEKLNTKLGECNDKIVELEVKIEERENEIQSLTAQDESQRNLIRELRNELQEYGRLFPPALYAAQKTLLASFSSDVVEGDTKCCICFTEDNDTTVQPCEHKFCSACAPAVGAECFTCRQVVEGKQAKA